MKTGSTEREPILSLASAYLRGTGRVPGAGLDACTSPALEEHFARAQVRADLALHALERVVHGLRVALEPLRDRLIAVPVEVEGQHRALQLRKHARQAGDQAVELLGGDHLVDRVVRGRAGKQLVELGIAVATAGGRRLGERDVLVQGGVLVAGGGLHRGDDLPGYAELGEVPETRLAVPAIVAHRLVEPDEPLLDQVVGVAADQEVGRRLQSDEPEIPLDYAVVGVLLALLGERDQVMIIKLNLSVRLERTGAERRGSCHRRLLGLGDALPPLASGSLRSSPRMG